MGDSSGDGINSSVIEGAPVNFRTVAIRGAAIRATVVRRTARNQQCNQLPQVLQPFT
jgi:hypothetical protein